MKSFFAIALAFLGTVQAQSACASVAQAIPSCGVACITSAASKIGCGASDYACQCSSANSLSIYDIAQYCIISSCTPVASAIAVQSSAYNVCQCVSTAAANVAGGSSTTASSSMATSSGSSMAGSSASLAQSTATSSMSASSSASAPATTSSASVSGTGNASTTSIGPATTETFTLAGAAAQAGSIGGLLAALLGALAYF